MSQRAEGAQTRGRHPWERGRRRRGAATAMLSAALVAAIVTPAVVGAGPSQPGFAERVVFSGLTFPTAFRFAPDGRVFVAEKSGVVKVFDNLADPTPTVFADLRTNVHDFWDRGLLGLALHPDFATKPYVYVLYTYDAAIGDTAPRWGDACPTPPGPTGDGCVVSGRLSRLLVGPGNVMSGSEQVLIEDWCQQYPSHSIGSLVFGPDGALYVSGGDGASFTFTDYGQKGSPLNPCGDPPTGAGTLLSPPTAEGGALRSQDLRTSGDPVTLDGAILRVDPETGAARGDNPLAGHADANARRIIAYGLRNPFRITTRPGTNELWVGDVGWNDWEEVNRITDAGDGVVENFGWPCYEGVGRQPGYDSANLSICENLYSQGGVTAPYHRYHHNDRVVAGESCPTGGSSVSGLSFTFYTGGGYPQEYDGALFFADYTRDCIWVMFKGTNGQPNPANIKTFVAGASNPVFLDVGPTGNLFYVDFDGGTIREIVYGSAPATCPVGQFKAEYFANQFLTDPSTFTQCENAISYDWGSGGPGNDVGPDTFSVRWTGRFDFPAGDTNFTARADDGIRVWVDGSLVIDAWVDQPPTTYSGTRSLTAGQHEVKVEYYEAFGGAVAQVSWQTPTVNQAPSATIAQPPSSLTWKVGDVISFSGSGSDPEDGALPASALSWALFMQHCPSTCHAHPVESFAGVASGSISAPDHDYPSHLELRLTATDSNGATGTTSVLLQPQAVDLSFQSSPTGLQLVVGSAQATAPFTRTVIVGSANTVSAPTPQTLGGVQYSFSSWSDGGDQTHSITAPATAATYTATFTAVADTTPPVISNVKVTGVNKSSATISWATDEPSDTQVEYGTTPSYGQSTTLQPALVSTHSQKLTGLSRATTYNFRVKSRDGAGNLAVSDNFTFRTR